MNVDGVDRVKANVVVVTMVAGVVSISVVLNVAVVDWSTVAEVETGGKAEVGKSTETEEVVPTTVVDGMPESVVEIAVLTEAEGVAEPLCWYTLRELIDQ